MTILKYCFVLLALFLSCNLYAKPEEAAKLWAKYRSEVDANERIRILLKLSHTVEDGNSIDSILNLAIGTAQLTASDSLIMECYLYYFNDRELQEDTAYLAGDGSGLDSLAMQYVMNMLSIAKKFNDNLWLYRTYYALSNIELDARQFSNAFDNVQRAFYFANLVEDARAKIKCIILMGDCQERLNIKIEAFKNYMNAMYLADEHDYFDLVYRSQERLATFYWSIKNFDAAKGYKRKQIATMYKIYPADSTRLMYLYNDLASFYYDNDEGGAGYKITKEVVSFAEHYKNDELKKDALVIYRTYLFDNGKLNTMADFYTKVHPEELNRMSVENFQLFYRLKACISEVNGDMDSAKYYYILAEQNLLGKKHSSDYYLSNFYKRFGQFLLRKGDIELAEQKMLNFYAYALNARFFPYIIEASGYLDSICNIQGNYKAAYEYAKINKLYSDSLALTAKTDELLRLEAENVEKEEQLAASRELAQTRRRHNIQYISIVIIIASSFVLLAMIGSFKVHRFVIQSIGFFCFILLFEFIIMVTDKQIEHLTHGEPWKILLFKIGIIAILSPTHHWLEHRVVHYLHEHKLIDASRFSLGFLKVWKKRGQKRRPVPGPVDREQNN